MITKSGIIMRLCNLSLAVRIPGANLARIEADVEVGCALLELDKTDIQQVKLFFGLNPQPTPIQLVIDEMAAEVTNPV